MSESLARYSDLLAALNEITRLRAEKANLLAALKETTEACAAAWRVINGNTDIVDRLEKELKEAGIADGFGMRARAAIAKAEDKQP